MTTKEESPLNEFSICGACGVPLEDPNLYTQDEIDNAKLSYCGCQESQQFQPSPREMYEAGIISKSEYEESMYG